MKLITFERVICNKKNNMDIIVISNFLQQYCKENKVKPVIKLASEGVPISSQKFNREMHKIFKGVDYIEVMSKCKFYEIDYNLKSDIYEEDLKEKEKKIQYLVTKIQCLKLKTNKSMQEIENLTLELNYEKDSYNKLVLKHFESRL